MKILQINAFYGFWSTGKIVQDLCEVINSSGNEAYVACAYSNNHENGSIYTVYGKDWLTPLRINTLIPRITGMTGYRNRERTRKLIEWVKNISPDIIHLHILHGDWLYLEDLFDYIKVEGIPVVWTFHDCWAFTGRCSHFEMENCYKWKTQCFNCKNKTVYPVTYFFDFSKKMHTDKKMLFSSLRKCVITTPSNWLANYVEQSFLKQYQVKVIHNGIDTSVYAKQNDKTDTNSNEKMIILGVASSWTEYKGLKDFVELDRMIDHSKYVITLVGLNDRQLKGLPNSIHGIKKTQNQQELVDLYNKAYVFLNLTYQDNFPTTNLEALSCGVPVITYNTGGSPESISSDTGFVVDKGDIESVLLAIEKIKNIDRNKCRIKAAEEFDKSKSFEDYINLYNMLQNYD